MHAHTRRDSGLTLMELMTAMFISFIAAVAVFALFLGQSRAMRQSQESMETHDNVRVALDLVGRDLRTAGFLVPSQGISIRVENNCGGSTDASGPAAPGIELDAGDNLKYPAGTANAVDVRGDIQGTLIEDGCPNGSDRLTIFYRTQLNFVPTLAASGVSKISWTCPGTDCSVPFALADINSTGCGSSVQSEVLPICSNTDPYRCIQARVVPQGSQCDCTETSNECVLDLENAATGSSVTDADWDVLCPNALCPTRDDKKENSGFQNWTTRTYQLLDLDSDGATELVVSDNQASFWVRPTAAAPTNMPPGSTPEPVNYNVVANYIDDFQVSVAYRAAPTTFLNVNLWNFPGCVESGLNHCLYTRTTAGTTNPPIAVRATVVARSSKRRVGDSGQVDPFGRGAVEDNAPPLDVYNPAAAVTPGAATCYAGETCGCGGSTVADLLKCSTNGNAQGYPRRIVTEVITLRNLNSVVAAPN